MGKLTQLKRMFSKNVFFYQLGKIMVKEEKNILTHEKWTKGKQ